MWEGQATRQPSAKAHAVAQPRAQAAANPSLGKQPAPPGLVLPLALPGATDHRAHGRQEKTREKGMEIRKRKGLWGVCISPWKGRKQRGRVAELAEDVRRESEGERKQREGVKGERWSRGVREPQELITG